MTAWCVGCRATDVKEHRSRTVRIGRRHGQVELTIVQPHQAYAYRRLRVGIERHGQHVEADLTPALAASLHRAVTAWRQETRR